MNKFLCSCSNTTFVVHYVEEMTYMQKEITTPKMKKETQKWGERKKIKKEKDPANTHHKLQGTKRHGNRWTSQLKWL